MKKLTKLIFVFVCILSIQNCKDDDFNNAGDTTNPETEAVLDEQFKSENFGNATTGKFIGTITDTSGNKLENVQITIGNTTTVTNNNGLFILNDVAVFENFAYVKAEKDGYIKGSRVVLPKTDGVNIINIALFQKDVIATVNSGETSQVSLPNGAEANFSGDFITAAGESYNGPVDVVLHYITPNSEETFTQMPGSLFAQTAANEARALETYGMLSVNLFSPSGEELNIDSNSPATIEFPVDVSQTSIAPETINLWYFDEENGYWKEEGQAIKEGNKYVAEVTHFTWWNCDIPFDSIEFCFSISPLHTDTTIPYYAVITRVSNNQIIYNGAVYAYDIECGLIPRNEEILVRIYSSSASCNEQLVHSETFGGYATDTSVNISFTEEVTSTSITGIATNCDGDPITNGYVYIDNDNTFSITDGTINFAYLNCSLETITFQILDFDTGLWAIIDNVFIDGNAVNLGAVSTCETGGGTYDGDVVLLTQEDVNDFGIFDYAIINGDLDIGSNSSSDNILDLAPLESLEMINGRFTIINNTALSSLNGLHNLETLHSLAILNNDQLTSLSGLDNLTAITAFTHISSNDGLISLEGLENLTSIDHFLLTSNSALTSLSALESLTEVHLLLVDHNDSLINFEGLEQVTSIAVLAIIENNSLESLNGLQNITSLIESQYAEAISIGVRPTFITNTTEVEPGPNPNLVDLCGLQNLFVNGNTSDFQIAIENNPINPTTQDFIDGNCSQ